MNKKEATERECENLGTVVAGAQYRVTAEAIEWLVDNTSRLYENNSISPSISDKIFVQGKLYTAKLGLDMAWKICERKDNSMYPENISGYDSVDEAMQRAVKYGKTFIKSLSKNLEMQIEEYKNNGKKALPQALSATTSSLNEVYDKL